jgi:hypothetical protein
MKAPILSLLLLCSSNSFAADQDLANKLVSVLRYGDVVDSTIQTCLETARNTNVEAELARTPGLFGDIGPDSPVWTATKDAYTSFLQASCHAFDKQKATDAVAREYAAGMTNSEIEAVLAFYQTPAGRKFRDAGTEANNAANREAMDPSVNQKAYDEYSREIVRLIREHQKLSADPAPQGAR